MYRSLKKRTEGTRKTYRDARRDVERKLTILAGKQQIYANV